MDFELPEDVRNICDVTRDIVRDLLPLEQQFVETGEVPPIVRQTLVENGYFGMALPEEYGGLGLGALAQAAVQIELAHLPPQFWTELRPLMGPGAKNIIYHASQAQREQPPAKSASPLR